MSVDRATMAKIASVAGLLPISVPAGLNSEDSPIGLQIVGRPINKQPVLDAGRAIEQRARFTPQLVK